MNSTRRNQLRDIQQQLKDVASRLATFQDGEREAYEYWIGTSQNPEICEGIQKAIGTLQEVCNQVLEAHDSIDGIFEL